MHISGNESAVLTRLSGMLACRDVPSPVRNGCLYPQPRRPADIPQVQFVRLGRTARQPRLCHDATDTRDQ